MPARITSTSHEWIGASTIALNEKQAREAARLGSVGVAVPEGELIEVRVLEVYCDACRRPFDDVCDVRCEAAASNEHLRGGPIGVRASRAHLYHDCDERHCHPNAQGA